MSTFAEKIRADMGMLYSFKEAEFNNILNYLIQQETLQPGIATALVQDIQRQQSAIKQRRMDLAEIRQSGLAGDQSLMVAIEKIKGDIAVGRMTAVTDVNKVKAKLEEQYSKDDRAADTKATQAFTGATDPSSRQYKELKNLTIVGAMLPADERQMVVDSAVRYFEGVHRGTMESLGNESVAYSIYNEKLDADLQDAITNRLSMGGFTRVSTADAASIKDEVLVELGLDAVEDSNLQRRLARQDFEEIKEEIKPGWAANPSKSKLIALGMDEASWEKATKTIDKRMASAAYYARYLPQFQEEHLKENENETYSQFIDRIENNDENAIALYRHVLRMEPADIKLLSEGQYARELYDIGLAEADLATARGQYRGLSGKAKRDYEDIYQEARQIYGSLFKRKGSPNERKMAEQRLTGDSRMQAAVSAIAEEDPLRLGPDVMPAEVAQAIGDAHTDDLLVYDKGTQGLEHDGQPIRTLDALFEATSEGLHPAAVETMREYMTALSQSPKTQRIMPVLMKQYAQMLQLPEKERLGWQQGIIEGFAERGTGYPRREGELSTRQPRSTTRRQPGGSAGPYVDPGADTREKIQQVLDEDANKQTSYSPEEDVLRRVLPGHAVEMLAAQTGRQAAGAANSHIQGQAWVEGTPIPGKALPKVQRALIDDYTAALNVEALTASQREAFEELGRVGGDRVTDRNIDDILGDDKHDPNKRLLATFVVENAKHYS
jgi:hypothetical protein